MMKLRLAETLRALVWVMIVTFAARPEPLAAPAAFFWKQPVSGAFTTAGNWITTEPSLQVDPAHNDDTATVPPRAGDTVTFLHGTYNVDMIGAPSLALLNFEDQNGPAELPFEIDLQVVGDLQVQEFLLPNVGTVTLSGGGDLDVTDQFWTVGAQLMIDGGTARLNMVHPPTGVGPEDPLRQIVVQTGGTLISTGPAAVSGVTLANGSLWEYDGEPDEFTSAVTLSGGSNFKADEINVLKTQMTAEGGSKFEISDFAGTSVQLSSGSQMINQNATAGSSPLHPATFVDGPKSDWTVSGTFVPRGASTVAIQNGGSMTCATISDKEPDGVILVRDDGSAFTITRDLTGTNGLAVLAKDGGHAIFPTVTLMSGELLAQGAGGEFHSAGAITLSKIMDVGYGLLEVTAGGKGSASDLTMHDGSAADISGTNSWLELTNNLEVGIMGAATFTIGSGGRVTSGAGYVGGTGAGDGSVTIQDAGSIWEVQAIGSIGDAGKGSVFMAGGGKLLVSSENSGLALGFEPTGRGIMQIYDGSMLEARGRVAVGKLGQGILVLGSGSSATVSHLSIGESAFTNRVTLTDPNTELRITGDLIAGNGGTGVLQAVSGSHISTPELRIGVESKTGTGVGTVSIQNAGSLLTISNKLVVGDSDVAVLTVSDGAHLEFQGPKVEVADFGAVGLLAVTGENSEMNATNAQMQVGVNGVATLTVSSGGVLRTKGAQAGINNAAQIIIGHPGALWDVGGDLEIGVNDFGYFTIDDQGVVNSTRGYLGRAAGSHGLLYVLRHSVWQPGEALTIGEGGLGNVIVNGGGRIELDPGTLDLGLMESSQASLSIELAGSEVNAALSTTRIGVKGDALVQITGGASLQTGPTSVAVGLATTAQVFVGGAQSIWTIENALQLGVAGQAQLTVDDRGEVVVNGPLTTGPGGHISGSGKITATKFIYSGILQPGHSPGALSLEGDFQQQSAGELDIEIAGTTPATQFDVVNVTGPVSLAGKIAFQFINGFAPRKGQTFEFITASGGITNNATTTISGLALGFQYDVRPGNKSLILEALSDGMATSIPQQPSLAIQPIGPELAVTWSSPQPNMTLQGSGSMNSANWTNLTSAHRWVVSPTNSAQFFRLNGQSP